jgi:dTDP-4-dehydrorhamnose reductase
MGLDEKTKFRGPIWVSGAGGLIGSYLVRELSSRGLPARGLTRKDFDLTDCSRLIEAYLREKPSAVIHCAAISSSVTCQKEPRLARKVNVFTTRFLADLSHAIPFFFFSTDLVFDGKKGNYQPEDEPNPLSLYAETKAEAERIVLSEPGHTVIRTSLNGGISPKGNRGFNEEIRNAWKEGKELCFFTDEYRCPIAARLTAQIVVDLLEKGVAGIVHVAGSGRFSRYEIAQILAKRYPELPALIRPGSLKEYTGAPRSPDTSLDISATEEFLGRKIPALDTWLQENPGEPF